MIHRGNPLRRLAVGITQDITKLKEAEAKIRHLTFYDDLTGLTNRALFREHWLKLLPITERSRSKAAVFFIDLDHFKRINDTLGHPCGDKALVTIAERLKKILRQSDIISRPDNGIMGSLISREGGEEFNIVVTEISNTDDLSFNLKVIAEGVETQEQKTALEKMKCDELQGYLLSRSIPLEEIELLLMSSPTLLKKTKANFHPANS